MQNNKLPPWDLCPVLSALVFHCNENMQLYEISFSVLLEVLKNQNPLLYHALGYKYRLERRSQRDKYSNWWSKHRHKFLSRSKLKMQRYQFMWQVGIQGYQTNAQTETRTKTQNSYFNPATATSEESEVCSACSQEFPSIEVITMANKKIDIRSSPGPIYVPTVRKKHSVLEKKSPPRNRISPNMKKELTKAKVCKHLALNDSSREHGRVI